jgi:hypothetical protein
MLPAGVGSSWALGRSGLSRTGRFSGRISVDEERLPSSGRSVERLLLKRSQGLILEANKKKLAVKEVEVREDTGEK